MSLQTLGLFFKEEKEIAQAAQEILEKLEKKGYKVLLIPEQANYLGRKKGGVKLDQLSKEAKILLAVGGDGTMLRAARFFAPYNLPIVGINTGRLGFLTEIHPPDVLKILPKVLDGNYFCDERMMIEARVFRDDEEEVGTALALNDVVITKSGIARLIRLHAYVDEELVTGYAADGLIVSTPTGSTAHNLAAGGPIIAPNLTSMILTAICPHTVNNRPVVVSGVTNQGKGRIRIEVGPTKEKEILLTADGQQLIPLKESDNVTIEPSKYTTKFVRLKPYNFYRVLREKLGWGL